MTGLTKPCSRCSGSGTIHFRDHPGDWDRDVCLDCDGGRVPVLESELEEHGQLNVLTEE